MAGPAPPSNPSANGRGRRTRTGFYVTPHTNEFDPEILAEADHWSLLLQVNLDPFTLYWLNRRGLPEPLDTVSFDHQCF